MNDSEIAGRRMFTGMRWYEMPLLAYFMLHYFPPGPPALANACLFLALVGVGWDCRHRVAEKVAICTHPLAWIWLALLVVLGLSIWQAPPALQMESWNRYRSEIGKGLLFGIILAVHLDDEDKARRLLWGGMVAGVLIGVHAFWVIVREVLHTGQIPRTRDYLYWLVGFFPFALGAYAFVPRWRWLAAVSAVSIVALAVLTSFRGALLALGVMALLFLCFARLWRLLLLAAVLAVATVAYVAMYFPNRAEQVIAQLQKTDTSGRVGSHWLPAWQLSLESPWLGHGYGHKVFGHAVHDGVAAHPEWLPPGESPVTWYPSSAHNFTLEVLFSAGFPGGIVLLAFVAAMLFYLAPPVWRMRRYLQAHPMLALAAVVLIAFIGNVLVLAQLEMPEWRTLAAQVGIALAFLSFLPKLVQFEMQGKKASADVPV